MGPLILSPDDKKYAAPYNKEIIPGLLTDKVIISDTKYAFIALKSREKRAMNLVLLICMIGLVILIGQGSQCYSIDLAIVIRNIMFDL